MTRNVFPLIHWLEFSINYLICSIINLRFVKSLSGQLQIAFFSILNSNQLFFPILSNTLAIHFTFVLSLSSYQTFAIDFFCSYWILFRKCSYGVDKKKGRRKQHNHFTKILFMFCLFGLLIFIDSLTTFFIGNLW